MQSVKDLNTMAMTAAALLMALGAALGIAWPREMQLPASVSFLTAGAVIIALLCRRPPPDDPPRRPPPPSPPPNFKVVG